MTVSHASMVPAAFAAAFNSGDPELLDAVYEPGAVFVDRSGAQSTGADRVAANTSFQGLGLPIEVVPRQVVVADDVALLVVDRVIEGAGADGPVRITGTATDVVRRGADGGWRYVVDCPFGVATGTL